MHLDQSLRGFVDEVASVPTDSAAFGAAALAGAAGAALLSMVCNLTVGREKHKKAEARLQHTLARTEAIRVEIAEMLQRSVSVAATLRQANALPGETDQERERRAAAIELAAIEAAKAPLHLVDLCAELVDLGIPVAELGNVNAVGDGAVGILLAESGLRGAALDAKRGLHLVRDKDFVARAGDQLRKQLARCAISRARVVYLAETRR